MADPGGKGTGKGNLPIHVLAELGLKTTCKLKGRRGAKDFKDDLEMDKANLDALSNSEIALGSCGHEQMCLSPLNPVRASEEFPDQILYTKRQSLSEPHSPKAGVFVYGFIWKEERLGCAFFFWVGFVFRQCESRAA